jgi:hypothetical protein
MRKNNSPRNTNALSPREEFISWGGQIHCLDGMKNWHQRLGMPRFYPPAVRRAVESNAQALRGALAKVGIEYSFEPGVIFLKNLQFIFSTKNPDFFLRGYRNHLTTKPIWRLAAPQKSNRYSSMAVTVEETISYNKRRPALNTLDEYHVRSKGREVMSPELFYFVPGLAVVTEHLRGAPQWAWIKRWLKSELNLDCPNVYDWWRDNCRMRGSDVGFKAHLFDAMLLSLNTCSDGIKDTTDCSRMRAIIRKRYPTFKGYFLQRRFSIVDAIAIRQKRAKRKK